MSDQPVVRAMAAADLPAVDWLHHTVFGPGRFARTAFRVRELSPPALHLSFIAETVGTPDTRPSLIGAVLQTVVQVGSSRVAWLGPIAVVAEARDNGTGACLMEAAIGAASEARLAAVLLVGDAPYYARFGFRTLGHPIGEPSPIVLPGPVDPSRFLVLPLGNPGADGPRPALRGGVVRAGRQETITIAPDQSAPDQSAPHQATPHQATNGSFINMVSSRSGLVDNNATGQPMSSSTRRTYLTA